MAARSAWIVGWAWATSAGVLAPAEVPALLDHGQYAQAEQAARAAVEQARGTAPADPEALAEALELLSQALVANGRVVDDVVEQAAREAVALLAARHGEASAEAARARATLAAALLARGQARAAAEQAESALASLTETDAVLRLALRVKAEARLALDEHDVALRAVDEALRLARADAPAGDDGLARLLEVRSGVLQRRGEWALAVEASREALALRGDGHPQSVLALLSLGDADWRAGRVDDAGQSYARASEVAAAGLRSGHPLRLHAEARLAFWEALQDRLAEALPRYATLLHEARATFGPDHPELADHLGDAGSARLVAGEPAIALELLRESLAILERAHHPASPALATPLFNLSQAYAAAGDAQRALDASARALDLWQRAYGPHDARV